MDLQQLERLRMETMERAVIDSIPPDLKAMMDEAQRKHVAKGGCPGCGSMVFAVHQVSCPTIADDLY